MKATVRAMRRCRRPGRAPTFSAPIRGTLAPLGDSLNRPSGAPYDHLADEQRAAGRARRCHARSLLDQRNRRSVPADTPHAQSADAARSFHESELLAGMAAGDGVGEAALASRGWVPSALGDIEAVLVYAARPSPEPCMRSKPDDEGGSDARSRRDDGGMNRAPNASCLAPRLTCSRYERGRTRHDPSGCGAGPPTDGRKHDQPKKSPHAQRLTQTASPIRSEQIDHAHGESLRPGIAIELVIALATDAIVNGRAR